MKIYNSLFCFKCKNCSWGRSKKILSPFLSAGSPPEAKSKDSSPCLFQVHELPLKPSIKIPSTCLFSNAGIAFFRPSLRSDSWSWKKNNCQELLYLTCDIWKICYLIETFRKYLGTWFFLHINYQARIKKIPWGIYRAFTGRARSVHGACT